MEKLENEQKCEHQSCQCSVKDGKRYCSDYCRDAVPLGNCECGHPECNL